MKGTCWPKNYCEDLNLIVVRAKEQRSEKICEILIGLNDRIMAAIKSLRKHPRKVSLGKYWSNNWITNFYHHRCSPRR